MKNKYFASETTFDKNSQELKIRQWIFAITKGGKVDYRLTLHGDTEIKRHIKVKTEASPYDGNLTYWSTRMGKHPLMPLRKAKLLKIQKGKCNWCNLTFRHDDVMEEDHITPKSQGGKDEYKNLQLLHRHCHDTKTTLDGSLKTYR